MNKAYPRYRTCSGKYALTVPFCERLFELARRPDEHGRGTGWAGQITSNSFMKREFGKKLVEEFRAKRVDLVEVIDTSGVYVPGHGTPTVILVGRNQAPTIPMVRTVLGIRGEPSPPRDPARGRVWTSIVENVDGPGAQIEYVSVTDVPRTLLARHPCSLSGGGAVQLKQRIEGAGHRRLKHFIDGSIGFASFTGLDDAFIMPPGKARKLKVDGDCPGRW